MAGTPKMQEHFSAGASMARHLETKNISVERPPEMQEQFPAVA